MGHVSLDIKRGSTKTGAFRKLDKDDKEFSWKDLPGAIWHFLAEDKRKFVFFNAFLFIVFFYDLVPSFIMGKVIDFFTQYQPGDSLRTFYYYVIFLSISWAVISIIRLRSKRALTRIGIAARSRAKVNGFDRLMDASIEWHTQENTGNKVQRVLTGSQGIFELIKLASSNLYLIVVNFIGVVLFFLFTNWIFLAFLAVYLGVFFVILLSYNKKMEAISLQSDKASEHSSGAYFESAGNVLSIKAVGAEQHVQARVKTNETKVRDLQFALTDTNNKKWMIFQVWNGLAFGVLLFLIGQQVVSGTMSIGLIMVIYIYFNKMREAANDMNDISIALVGFKVDIGRLMPIFREKSAIRSGTKEFPKAWDALSLTDASFAYPNGQIGLKHINLNIAAGERIGVAGMSGSGKSTLIRILIGLYELKTGSFKVGETDFYDISREEITRNIAVVLQETELFNLSLKDNITMMRDFDPELLARAIHIADLGEVINRLPEKLDTTIGERGYNLSGGERQRIGIARAIYKNCPVLLLDEATSALDSQTEKNIVDRLFNELGKEKTFVIVAHRLSTLKNADRVIVVDSGEIAEEGSFQALIDEPNSCLSKLYALQNTKT